MFDFWETDLGEQEEEALIEKAANEIRKRKLELPAILVLESHKPFAYIAANAGVAFAPFLVPFLGFDAINNYSRVLTNRENVERLLKKLEQPRPEPAAQTEDACTS